MNSRELIVSGPAGDPLVAEQLQALRTDPDGARERELAVSELWARIDAMPMRRRELREAPAAAPQQTRPL